jgi:hypothetical protein
MDINIATKANDVYAYDVDRQPANIQILLKIVVEIYACNAHIDLML